MSRYGSAYLSAFSDAPKSVKRGFAKIMHKAVKMAANVQTIVKLVFIIVFAALSSLMPLFIEKSGAPPLPKRFEKAIVSIIIGKQSPTAPSAVVPTSGMRAMYMRSTMLYNRLRICATSMGRAACNMFFFIESLSKSIFFIRYLFWICFVHYITTYKKIKGSASFDIDFIYDKLKEKYILQ